MRTQYYKANFTLKQPRWIWVENRPLHGQETEVAIRFDPQGGSHPGNKVIFEYLTQALQKIVRTKPGKRNFIQDQFFVENGGAIYYEHHPQSLQKGLIEFATPECHSAHELVLYQRAQEALLCRALPIAQKMMSYDGIDGELSLIKNGRDYEGNTYGSQENYDSFIARGMTFYILCTLLIAYVPLAMALKLVYIALLVPFILTVFVLKVSLEFVSIFRMFPLIGKLHDQVLPRLGQYWYDKSDSSFKDSSEQQEEFLLSIEYSMFYPLFWISYKPLILICKGFAFREQSRSIHAHIVSRMIYTGVGSLIENGVFVISEKATGINCITRRSIHRTDKPMIDSGNVIKEFELAVWDAFLFRFQSWSNILKKEQRLQISCSDSNRCQVAEFLKVATTSLIVRMSNDGFISDAPQLVDPIASLNMVGRDLDLKDKMLTRSGQSLSAIEIQRWYLNKSEQYLNQQKTVTLEDQETLRLWKQVLDCLEHAPQSLIGRIDWITKAQLIEQAGADLDYWGKKKIDIKYHELGSGYYEDMQAQGLSLDIFDSSEIEEAIHKPSSCLRAQMRSHLIKNVALDQYPMTISWSKARLGRWNRKVISLENYKNDKDLDSIV